MIDGVRFFPGLLGPEAQTDLLSAVLERVQSAPFYHAVTPSGRRMSVANTNFGRLGWVSDRSGYRYQPTHPQTGMAWPDIPELLQKLWAELTGAGAPCDACLVNRYDEKARLSLHQDADEADFSFPVVSVSLGDTALFRMGGLVRGDPTQAFRIASGDVLLLASEARRAFHGVDRIYPGTCRLIPGGGRINLTLRRAAPAL